ncbi:transposase family protein [Streptomyces sp. Y20]
MAGQLAAGRRGHPWSGWSFSGGWGSREQLDVTLVEPELVVEVGVDVARDTSAGGGTPPAGTAPAPTCPPPTFPAWRRRHTDGDGARRRPGATHDNTAARHDHILAHLSAAGLGALGDLGFHDPVIVTGYTASRTHKLTLGEKEANRVLAIGRAPVEHGFAHLKNWRIPSKLRTDPASAPTWGALRRLPERTPRDHVPTMSGWSRNRPAAWDVTVACDVVRGQ